MAAHGMTEDALAFHVGREVGGDKGVQFASDILVHAEMLVPRRLGGGEIEAGALAEIIGFIIRHARSARAGIGRDDHDAMFGGGALEAGLFPSHWPRCR